MSDSYTIVTYNANELPEDFIGLVYSRWLRSYRAGNDFIRLIDARSYYGAYENYVHAILRKKDTKIRLAVLTDAKDVALGFCVYRGNILDFVHVQKDVRKQDIAKHLIPEGIDTFTHITRKAMSIWNNKKPTWKFNPFI